MRTFTASVTILAALLATLVPAGSVLANHPGPAMEARADYAGLYKDGGTDVYLFTDEDPGVVALVDRKYEDGGRYEIRVVEHAWSELQAVRAAIERWWREEDADGFDIRELGIDVVGNRVAVGAYDSLGPIRETLAEYGDMVHVSWSEGGYTGDEPAHDTAVRTVDEVKVRLTLDDYPLVAGEPAWITAKIRNEGDTAVSYVTDTCDIPFGIHGQMVGESWRPFEPTSLEAIHAAGYASGYEDLRWRLEQEHAGDPAIRLGFAPKGALGPEEWGCGGDIGRGHRLAPGETVEWRMRWDGGTIGSYPAGSFGPPPDGLARLSGSFEFKRVGTPGKQTVEVVLEVPVTEGRDPALLQPMEAVDAALADEAFAALIEPIDIGNGWDEQLLFDAGRGVWVVGACGDRPRQAGTWKAAVVDARSGEVRWLLDRTTGRPCYAGPWEARS